MYLNGIIPIRSRGRISNRTGRHRYKERNAGPNDRTSRFCCCLGKPFGVNFHSANSALEVHTTCPKRESNEW